MYDYVIVGAGSAGCVLAGRLSEDPDVRVCLIEAGPPDTAAEVHLPVAGGRLLHTRYDWDYDSQYEPHCDDRRLYLPRGRVIGGGSSLGGMVYVRGVPADYDGWGRRGWGWDDLLPYFRRSEDNERGASRWHGVGGPLAVSDNRSRNPISTAFLQAAAEAGHPSNADFNGPVQDGFGWYQLTQRDGRRCSAAMAYLHPVRGRPNLHVETHLLVRAVMVHRGRAVGVSAVRLDHEVEIPATREVILAAGAYNSPQLLLRSGIGPAALIRGLGVPVVLDQPEVGRNLQDHASTWLAWGHRHPVSLLAAERPDAVAEYAEHRRGPLSSNGPEVGGFVRTRPGLDTPDVQFSGVPAMVLDGGVTPPTGHGFALAVCTLAPRSRGRVTITSADPTAQPVITHNYLAEPADLDTAVAGLRCALDIAARPALAPYTETPVRVPRSDHEVDLRAYVRRQTHTHHHPVGTCALGRVVDDELRVYGIDRLRVVDASVLPGVVRGDTNAAVVAIAEKASDLVRGRATPPGPDAPRR